MKHDPANINAENLPRKNKRFSNTAKFGYTVELILSAVVAVGGFVSTIMTNRGFTHAILVDNRACGYLYGNWCLDIY